MPEPAKSPLAVYKWQILAAGILLFAMFSRGGMGIFVPLLRLIAPVLLVVMVWKIAKRKLLGLAQDKFKSGLDDVVHRMQEMQAQQQRGGPSGPSARSSSSGQTIDLCPECGSILQAGHKCARN